MKKIPIFLKKGKLPEGKYTIGQIVSPELQAEYLLYISQPWFKVHKPPTFDEWKLQRQRLLERLSVAKSDTRSKYQREQDLKRASVERERRLMKKALLEAVTVAGEVLNRTMPSTIARAAYDAATGDKSFVGSMIEGNKGLGHPVANLAFDLTSPFILNKGFQLGTKGFKYAWEALPNISLAKTPSGDWNGWINIGNYQYRPNRSSLGMGKLIERRPIPINEIFELNRWNRFRDPKYVTEFDKTELESHFPEYKAILERGMDEGNYMIIPENSPLSKTSVQLDDGRLLFTGDEGTWILSQSENFKSKFRDKTLKVGYKGGVDLKSVEGGILEHAPETFPEQDKGIFFAADKRYADRYNHGSKETPGFWLGFRSPYNMLEGGLKPFLLESEAIRYMRSIDAAPSFKNFPDKPFEVLSSIWGDLNYLKDPKIMSIITKDPNKMTKSELAERVKILSEIRAKQNNDRVKLFGRMVDYNVKSGKWHPERSTHYDGYIGRDHTLLWSPEYDVMAPFGSHPESYVITKPELASILVGNNGAFNGPAYTRKFGGKLLKIRKK